MTNEERISNIKEQFDALEDSLKIATIRELMQATKDKLVVEVEELKGKLIETEKKLQSMDRLDVLQSKSPNTCGKVLSALEDYDYTKYVP